MRTKEVFVVEDYAPSLRMLQTVLSAAGYHVVTAATGEKALALAHEKLDLIILDICLPGISGFDVAQRLVRQSSTREIPLLGLTGQSEGDEWLYTKGARFRVVSQFEDSN